jgi:hypothetical protein
MISYWQNIYLINSSNDAIQVLIFVFNRNDDLDR